MRTGKLYVAVSAVLTTVLLWSVSLAQTGTQRAGREQLETGQPQAPSMSFSQAGVALESTIDPEHYYVGPSDVFSVNLSVNPEGMFLLTVTPEGTLIIPTIGVVRVSDLTLAEAKDRVIGLIRQKYRGAVDASMTLVTPRSVVVIVTGYVVNPGSYVLPSYFRADKAIEEANKLRSYQTPAELRQTEREMSRRNISVRHKDGTAERIDLPKYLATREDRWNPYLREGDLIVVPRVDQVKRGIGVFGEVNSPNRYEFVAGDSVRDVFLIANGFTERALADSVEFSRFGLDGETMTSRIINAMEILAGTQPDFSLQPGDRLIVRAKPDFRGNDIVTIEGEVVFPGIYPITRRGTRLSEILRKAGGFTEFASLQHSELLRKSVREDEIDLERLESDRGGVTPDDSAYYYLETELRIFKEIVNVDFEKLVLEGDSTQDVLMQNGDLIRVPSQKRTIYVFGQVVSTGHVPFVPGEEVDYYIRKAGGITERAREGDIKIVKAKTKQWLSPDETILEEGDYVWVPKDVERPFAYYLAIVGQTASIVSVALSVVLLAIQINK
jgi:protein involved in polysaccharide export with SLBB domain